MSRNYTTYDFQYNSILGKPGIQPTVYRARMADCAECGVSFLKLNPMVNTCSSECRQKRRVRVQKRAADKYRQRQGSK